MRRLHHLPRGIHRHRPGYRLVLAEEAGVDVNSGLELRGELRIEEDRVDRTDHLALLALDADVRVDVELRSVRGGVDAGDGADFDAGPVPGAAVNDDVGHSTSSPA